MKTIVLTLAALCGLSFCEEAVKPPRPPVEEIEIVEKIVKPDNALSIKEFSNVASDGTICIRDNTTFETRIYISIEDSECISELLKKGANWCSVATQNKLETFKSVGSCNKISLYFKSNNEGKDVKLQLELNGGAFNHGSINLSASEAIKFSDRLISLKPIAIDAAKKSAEMKAKADALLK